MSTQHDPSKIQRRLGELLRGEVRADLLTRHLYSTAACIHRVVPLTVVFPMDEEDVVHTVRYCAEERIPLTARGAGTSLAGQALGEGVILDFSRHMTAILATDPAKRTARVQPGVIAGSLGERLEPYGLFFPAEPSSGAFCTFGGMVANNASGARSLRYGATRDYLLQAEAVLADGSSISLQRKNSAQWTSLERNMHQTLRGAAGLIEHHGTTFPKNSSGYLLRGAAGDGWVDLVKVIAGSEGTLALVTEIELGLRPVPPARALALLSFGSLEEATEGIVQALTADPSALEIMGRDGIEIVRQSEPSLTRGLPDRLEAALLIEAEGENLNEAAETLRSLEASLTRIATGSRIALTDEDQNELWALRKAGLPILYRRPGPRRVAAFIEDNAVPPNRIAEYIRGLRKILGQHGLEMALFGHAGQGNFHVRPLVDLSSPGDIEAMAQVAREVAELVVSLGGSLSGEHGDGRSRSEFLPLLHGPLYPVMESVKRAFDPEGTLNPGIIIGAGNGTLTAALRMDPGHRFSSDTRLSFPPEEKSLQENVERCQGCGTCRTVDGPGRMCPVYRATLREEFSPRAKANLLGALHTGRLPLSEENIETVASRCLQCSMCAAECPAGVDVPALVLELRARLAAQRGVGLRERFFDWLHFIAPLTGRLHALVNPVLENRLLRHIMQQTLGIAADATLPPLHPPRRRSAGGEGNMVAYLSDTYAGRLNPQTGQAIRSILRACGLKVVEPSGQPSGAVAMMCGSFSAASREVRKNLDRLHPPAEAGVPIIVSEPTAYHAIKHLWRHYSDDPRVEAVARQTEYLHEFLLQRDLPIPAAGDRRALRIVYHTPCHVIRQDWDPPLPRLLERFHGVEVEVLDEGCCGAAGTFGYKTETYELSKAIGQPLAQRLGRDDFDLAVTDCSSCLMRMQESTSKAVHAAEFIAYALGVGPPPGACQGLSP